jgi:glycosyltransferase involved in cell wall biosynthesis
MRIDQWVPALHRGDAIGDSARLMRDAFRRWGHEADVYAFDMDDDLEGDGRYYRDWKAGRPNDVLIFHYALPSAMTHHLREHKGRRVVIHHNVTPPEFFDPWDAEMIRICRIGREELSLLKDVDLGLGDSEYNRQELEDAGFKKTGVLPIYLDFERYRQPANPVLLRLMSEASTNVLFVGRVSPNKRHDDLIRLASYWKKFISADVRLALVGKLPRKHEYFDALQRHVYECGFTPWEVLWLGHVEHDDLLACYRGADVFVSMSEHEGFGVPLVEAMLMDVPIVAYRCTAVGHTLGDAGLQFAEKNIAQMAEAAHLVARDPAARAAALAGQAKRLPAFSPETVEATLKKHLEL